MDSADFVSQFLHLDDYHQLILRQSQQLYESARRDADLGDRDNDDLERKIAHIFAKSKRHANELKGSGVRKVGVVFAMWREVLRLKPYALTNPVGENSLLRKVESLGWLLEGSDIQWCLYAVDDGCPENSYAVAKQIVVDHNLSDRVKILHLRDFIGTGGRPLDKLASVDDSVKGGSIIAGCIGAIEDGCTHICYTDSDNSIDLAQLGAYLIEMAGGDSAVACGDRFRDRTYKLWWDRRREMDPLFYLHIRRLLTWDIFPTRDIPCPLKVFSASELEKHLPNMETFDFSFDFELLCQLRGNGQSLRIVDCLSVDSFESSTWHALSNDAINFQKITGAAQAVRKYGIEKKLTVAEFVLSEITSPAIITSIRLSETPAQLRNRDLQDIGKLDIMQMDDMRQYVRALSTAQRSTC